MHEIETIDLHVAGEPLRVIVNGFPEPAGATMLERRADSKNHHDELRRALMLEPRGHADMYGALPLPPASLDGDLGVLFLHNEGYSTMCGHGIIGLVTAGIEAGIFPVRDPGRIRIDTPAGRVVARAAVDGGRVVSVAFRNVPSFVLLENRELRVPGLGRFAVDLAYGGAFYVYVETTELSVRLEPDNTAEIIAQGMAIKRAAEDGFEIRHPDGPSDLNFVYGTIFVERHPKGPVHSRNVCVFADGQIDRSPTGTGVSGRAAIHHARGELSAGESLEIESLIGTRFTVTCVEETTVGDRPAIIPEVSGRAFVTGRHRFTIDPDDPLRSGFLVK